MAGRPDSDAVVALARRAGREILRWYGAGVTVEEKDDASPVTEADRVSHTLIVEGLASLSPDIPVVSEESSPSERSTWEGRGRHWLVDPLDGTKEFLKETGEFTVNIALVDEGVPVMGVVHAPVLEWTYVAEEGGAVKIDTEGRRSIRTRPFDPTCPVLVASRDHSGPAVRAFAESLGPSVAFAAMGSSLKFCLVAEGRADAYLRDGPTMEWDTAAAQCVVEAAGGMVLALDDADGASLRYGKASLTNPGFLCAGDRTAPWMRSWLESIRSDSGKGA